MAPELAEPSLRRHGRPARRQRHGHRRRRRRATTASADSSPPSTPTPALSSGGAGPCRAAASPASKPGKARNRSPAAAPPGSPAPTTPSSDTLYWATGNPVARLRRPRPSRRQSLHQLRARARTPKTGEIKWHYQFTPHDVKDRDATEPNVLVDTVYQGKPSKLLLHADRNGFFYVLDRTNGKVLLAKPFLRRVDWASSIGADGRPVVTDPRGCPSDAANWASTAYSPQTRPLLLHGARRMRRRQPTGYPDQTGQRFLRALNIETGEIVVGGSAARAPRAPRPGSGVLATAGGPDLLRPAERRLHRRRSAQRQDALAVSRPTSA